MDAREMIVLIVFIVVMGRVISARYGVNAWGRKRDRGFVNLPPQDAVSVDDGARMKAEIDRLNNRVQVLERLVTDPSRRLSDQIDALGPKSIHDR